MANPVFRLATLLKLREALRDERRNRLAEAVQAETVLNQRRDELDNDLNELMDSARKLSRRGTVNLEPLLAAGRYELELRTEQRVIDRQKQTLAKEIESRRSQLVEADRDVRVLEKLREKQLERHREHLRRVEQKEHDERAVARRIEEESSC